MSARNSLSLVIATENGIRKNIVEHHQKMMLLSLR